MPIKKKTIVMSFHCAGVVTTERTEVVSETEKTITLYRGEVEAHDHWRFDKKTGKCLNDETSFGCYRTISPVKEKSGEGKFYASWEEFDVPAAFKGVEVALMMASVIKERACRVCGCTENNACLSAEFGPCWWVEYDLCSHCQEGAVSIRKMPIAKRS